MTKPADASARSPPPERIRRFLKPSRLLFV